MFYLKIFAASIVLLISRAFEREREREIGFDLYSTHSVNWFSFEYLQIKLKITIPRMKWNIMIPTCVDTLVGYTILILHRSTWVYIVYITGWHSQSIYNHHKRNAQHIRITAVNPPMDDYFANAFVIINFRTSADTIQNKMYPISLNQTV